MPNCDTAGENMNDTPTQRKKYLILHLIIDKHLCSPDPVSSCSHLSVLHIKSNPLWEFTLM